MPQVDTDNQFQEDHTGISFAYCLEQLASMTPITNCRTCKGPLLVKSSQVGTAIYLKWVWLILFVYCSIQGLSFLLYNILYIVKLFNTIWIHFLQQFTLFCLTFPIYLLYYLSINLTKMWIHTIFVIVCLFCMLFHVARAI